MKPNHMQGSGAVQMQIPPELLRSVPREVALTGAGKAARGIAIALALGAFAAGVALYLTAVRQAEHYKLIRQQSVVTEGRVTGWGKVRDGKRVVSYSFPHDGREYTGRETLQSRSWRALPVGASLPVRYLPATPEQNWILGYEPSGVPFWVAGVAPISMWFVPLLIVRGLRKERKLLAEGRPALARVTGVKQIHAHRGVHGIPGTPQRGGYRINYEFRDLSGAVHAGRANMAQNVPPEGSPLVIVYDIDEPRRSAPYPFQCVRIDAPAN